MHKILVVDDNKYNIRIVREAMNSLGYGVIEAYDGAEGMEKAKHELPDLIFMDIHMPKMDGIKAMKGIKGLPNLSNVPIIAYTAYAMKGDREKFLSEGFDEYISKPVSLAGIQDTAQKLLHQTA
ncbi:MAG: response regulator [Bacteroidales bacterium]|nr:response regulator [Bacteroidales bacterium]